MFASVEVVFVGLWSSVLRSSVDHLIASVEVVLVERGVRYSRLYLQILGGGSLGGSPRWTS